MNKSVLPALSVALGVPLGHTAKNESSSLASSSNSSVTSLSSSENETTSSDNTESAYAQRARNNVARIYARRMMDRAQLERRHPWAQAAAASDDDDGPSSKVLSATNNQERRNNYSNHNTTMSTNMLEEAQTKLLSETLLSIIQMKEQLSKVKSLSSGDYTSYGGKNHHLLHQLGINHNVDTSTNITTTNAIAACEANSDAGFRDRYNAIDASSPPTSLHADSRDKPAEWGDDSINLAERRQQFGQEISPLSNTTRMQRWGMAVKRMVTLGTLAAPLGVMVPASVVLGSLAGSPDQQETNDGNSEVDTKNLSMLQRYHQKLSQSTWDYALWAIESAGPTYIKLVQWASTRNDLFSPEFVGHFSKLQDETRGHSWRETEKCLERAYGKDWKNILSFDRIIEDDEDESDDAEGGRLKRTGGAANRERQKRLERQETQSSSSSSANKQAPTIPIGSGCVAQVYKARLCSSHGLNPAGTSVAVKVQHPRILEKVCLDFYLLNKFASFLEYIPYLNLDYLSMKDSVDQFRDIMLPQLDLRVEAHNLQRFRRDFDGESQINFPEPLVELTSREVLVEKFVEGEPMLNFVLKEDETHSKKDREELARIGLETVMKMIFLHDFVHADLHPGNMIVDRNNSVRGSPLRIHMIDCGLTVELGESDHKNLVKILGSLIKRDGYLAGQLMVDTAKKCQATELDVELFCRGIQKICDDDEENNFLESVGDYITDICYMACKHKVKLEAAFINAALACEIMEGLAASLYPTMQVQSVALPMVVKSEMMHGLKGMPKLW